MSTALLEIRDLAFGYRNSDPDVLDGIDFTIEEGTVTAMLGRNGAGKSTLFALILGWLRPGRGRILLGGRHLREYSRNELGRSMSLVPQSEHMPFDFSVQDYVLLGRSPHLPSLRMPDAGDLRIARDAIARAGIDDLALRPVTELSGGELQLVLIARSLAQQPRLLLLDEPASHLDPANRKRLLAILSSLAGQGLTVLLSTHDPDMAAVAASRAILLAGGRVSARGSIDQVLTEEHLRAAYGTDLMLFRAGERLMIRWDV